MAHISMKRPHHLEPDKVEPMIEKLAERIAGKLGGTWCWEGKTAVCQARGAKAEVGYDTESISIDVTLPRLLRPLKGQLEAKVDEYYRRYFEG